MQSDRPLVTFALFTYCQQAFVADAVRSALAQGYEPLEIIISDDCSPDATFERITDAVSDYDGPHKLVVNRNDHNLGIARHLSAVMARARGEYIIGAAGDDISLPNRAELLVQAFRARTERPVLALSSLATVIDADGRSHGLYQGAPTPASLTIEAAAHQRAGFLGCSSGWHRSVFDSFGEFRDDTLKEDLVIPLRASLLGSISFVPEPLVQYRLHGANVHFKEASSVKDAEELFADMRKHAAPNIAAVRTMIDDVNLVLERQPERRDELASIQVILDGSLRDAVFEQALLEQPGRAQQTILLLKALRGGTSHRRLIRWALTFEAPSLYLSLRRWQRSRQLRAVQPPVDG